MSVAKDIQRGAALVFATLAATPLDPETVAVKREAVRRAC